MKNDNKETQWFIKKGKKNNRTHRTIFDSVYVNEDFQADSWLNLNKGNWTLY